MTQNTDILQAEEQLPSNTEQESEQITQDVTQISEVNAPCVQKTALEELIDKDFDTFSRSYPNVSRELLSLDTELALYVKHAGGTSLNEVYKDYKALCDKIELKIMRTLSNKANAVGSLSSCAPQESGFYTREQVLAMSSEEIKRNFDKIRKSQERW